MASSCWRKDLLIITWTLLIYNSLIASCSSDSSALKRCCGSQGSALALKDGTYSCKSAPGNGVEFFERSQGYRGLPVCQNGGKLRTIPLDDLKSSDFIRGNFCTDILLDSINNNDNAVVLSCDNSNPSWEQRNIPKILNIRRCCPRGEIFRMNNRACSIPDHDDDEEDILTESLLRNIGSFDFIRAIRGPPKCGYAIVDYEVNATDISVVGGRLQVGISKSGDIVDLILTEETACLDVGSEPGLLVVRACRGVDYCRRNSCVRKCCQEDEAFVKGECKKLSPDLTVSRWHSEVWNLSINTENATGGVLNTTEYGLILDSPCPYGMWPAELDRDHWHIVKEGWVHVPGYKTYEHDSHCVEMFYYHSDLADGFYSFICHEHPATPPTEHESEEIRHWVTAALSLISCAFLLITLFVYACLPSLRNLPGKIQMCYVASLLTAFGCLALVSIASPKIKLDDPNNPDAGTGGGRMCAIWGYTMLFSFFASFSWLNVMCFDVWWKFGSLTRSRSSSPNGKDHWKRFISYCIFAYGLPLAVLVFAISADRHEILPKRYRPDIGNNTCWFAKGPELYGHLTFFIIPLTVQMLINLVFFIITVRRCNLTKADLHGRCDVDRSDSRNRRLEANKARLILNLKLFVFMGISWVMEIVSYFCTIYASDAKLTKKLFYVTDVVNLLQGLLIFVILIMKPKVFRLLRKRFTLNSGSRRSSNGGIHDPYRIRKSPSNSTMLSIFPTSSSP